MVLVCYRFSRFPFLKNFPNNLDHILFSIQQCLSIRPAVSSTVQSVHPVSNSAYECPTVNSVLTVSTSVQQCSALSIRCPAVPGCVQVSVSVQQCPDHVHGVQHCPAVFSSIQHRPAVFRCLVVPSCSTVSVGVQTASVQSEVFNLV